MALRNSIALFLRGLQFVAIVSGMSGSLVAQMMDVPAEVQVPLFLKATTYDRNFATKLQKNGVLHVGICYQEKNRVSMKEMEDLQSALLKPVAGFSLQISLLSVGESQDFSKLEEWESLSVIYITTMRGIDLKNLLNQAQTHKVMTVSTDPALGQKGVSMSFELLGARPHFVINHASSLKEGCDFSSQLLKLATVH